MKLITREKLEKILRKNPARRYSHQLPSFARSMEVGSIVRITAGDMRRMGYSKGTNPASTFRIAVQKVGYKLKVYTPHKTRDKSWAIERIA